ncbi:MAG: collagen-like protein [Bacteroidota bacterium]
MKKTSILVFTALLLFAIFQACKGPQGDPGPAGVQGIQGLTGTQGLAGKDANKVRFSNWQFYTHWSGVSASLDRRASNINIEGLFIEDGVFLLYVLKNGTAKLIPSQYNNSVYLDYGISKQINNNVIIELIGKTETSGALSHQLMYDLKFRWVFIPLSNSGKKAAIDYSDYEGVKKAYNIQG